ncbi:hypothetical protein BDN72DRAFT_237044 [Pluteus cervinus]|uniref:Uncharacterized protein n=1 Tax=Pluteus cervinus TaxID=181527 RepID=A0ACD3BEJ3_9AGAR|nr:hypothetical protein BDN72DRAFT_237044 [Pluteus cervinus]
MNGLGPSNLKRKRETPESPPSPAKMRPIVVVRQALSVSRTEPSTTTGSSRSTSSSSSAAQRVYGKARNAPPPTIPSEPSTSKSQVFSPPPPPSIKSPPPPPTRIPSPSHIPIPSQSIESVLESTISNSQADRSSSPPAPTNPSTSDVEDDLTSVSVPTSSERSTSRRITRLRKPTNTDGSDVFRERPTASRRKAQTRSEAEGFGGLSAVALKAMTSTNTTRNQHYLSVTIATEVVKKDGNRPESPVMKVKTTLQKQQEEKDKQRQERAERRARRSAGDTDIDNSIELEASKVESSVDGESDGEVLLPGGFRKGAGDEDDYQAPGQVVNGSEDRLAAKRRVAWDRGLFTTIYLDEVKLGSRPPPKENMSLKGCLAPACKVWKVYPNHPYRSIIRFHCHRQCN